MPIQFNIDFATPTSKPTIQAEGKYSTKASWESWSLFASASTFTCTDSENDDKNNTNNNNTNNNTNNNPPKLANMSESTMEHQLKDLIQNYEVQTNCLETSMSPKKCWIQDLKNDPKQPRPYQICDWKPVKITVEPKKVHIVNVRQEKRFSLSQQQQQRGRRRSSSSNPSSSSSSSSSSTTNKKVEQRWDAKNATCPEASTETFSKIFTPNVVQTSDCTGGTFIKKHIVHARVYYKVSLSGTVAADFGTKREQSYWNYPVGDLLKYNGIESTILITEDIEIECSGPNDQ